MILYLVDEFGGVLETYAHGNALGLDVYSRGVEVAVYVACRVTRGKDDGATEGTSVMGLYTHDLALLDDEAIHACLKVYLTPATTNRLAHILDDAG